MYTTVNLAFQHIIKHLTDTRPLFVGLQGPQGSGKSYLAAQLYTRLHSANHRVAVLSIDDLYLPHNDLVELSHSRNPLWNGRGHPGTHDTALGIEILSSLKSACRTVELPRFDKSLYEGEGDRHPLDGTGIVIDQPPAVDVIILEGWLVGFHPISNEDLHFRWKTLWKEERQKLGLPETIQIADIQAINDKLQEYLPLWNFLDIFMQLKTNPQSPTQSRYSIVYKWRLEQEHYMKAHNGGRGMSDSAVKSFVDRYIPGYVFFGDSPDRLCKQIGGLILYLDENRAVTDVGNVSSEPF